MIPALQCVRQIPIDYVGQVSFNVNPLFIVISEQFRSTYCFDYDGRWLSCFLDGKNYKRGVANDVLMKYILADTSRQRQVLMPDDVRQLVERIQTRMTYIRQHLPKEGFDDIATWLDRVLCWDYDRLEAEQALFDAIYLPVGILPPDQYLSVVLQATEGCTWNQCTFCSFYQDRPFRIKSPAQFRTHAQQVQAFFGNAIGLRKSLFLGDANALIIPQTRLMEIIKIVHEVFPVGLPRAGFSYVMDGIYAFLDIFGAERKREQDYRELQEAHVKRIYIGLETGDTTLFRLLNKPGSPAECRDAVRTIKAAGIQVGIILLAGAGGHQMYQQHFTQSVEIVKQMHLDRGDIVYLSPLVISGGEHYTQHMVEQGIVPLTQEQTMVQVEQFKAAIKQEGGPRVTLYHIQEFLY